MTELHQRVLPRVNLPASLSAIHFANTCVTPGKITDLCNYGPTTSVRSLTRSLQRGGAAGGPPGQCVAGAAAGAAIGLDPVSRRMAT